MSTAPSCYCCLWQFYFLYQERNNIIGGLSFKKKLILVKKLHQVFLLDIGKWEAMYMCMINMGGQCAEVTLIWDFLPPITVTTYKTSQLCYRLGHWTNVYLWQRQSLTTRASRPLSLNIYTIIQWPRLARILRQLIFGLLRNIVLK